MSHFNLDSNRNHHVLGSRLIMSVFRPLVNISMLMLYDLKENKTVWSVDCRCKWDSIDGKVCVMRCICWSAHERQIVT